MGFRRKIMSGYAAMGVLAGLVVGISLLYLRHVEQRHIVLLHQEQTVALLATRLENISRGQMQSTHGYLLAGAEPFLTQQQALAEEMSALHAQLIPLATTPEDQALLEHARQLSADFQALARDAIRIRREGDTAAALALYQTQVEPLGTRMTDAHHDLVEVAMRQANLTSAELQQRSQQTMLLLAILMGAMILGCLGLGAAISRDLSTLLGQILAGVQAVARGDLKQAVPVRSSDEIGQLAEGVNQMRQALLESEDRRSDFISMICHELRAPVATIYSFSVFLSREGHLLSQEELATYLGAVARQADNLIRLVDDFVIVERLDAGRLSYAFSPVHVGALLDEISKDFREMHPAKAILLRPGDEPDVVQGDALRLKQVLTNVVECTVRLAPDSPVTLGWSGNGKGEMCITVSDRGLHIPPNQVEALFAKFGRIQNGKGGSVRGGLGLYIAKRIVEAHGGSIQVETTPDQGTTFSIALPIWVAPAHT